MIDWLNLIFNSIWIFAIALALAVVSIAYYQSRQKGEKFRTVLDSSNYALPLNLAGAIFCLGMALSSSKWWEILLWIVLLVLFSRQGLKICKYKIED